MAPEKLKRKLTAILSADVKGYSRLMGEDEEWTLRTLNSYKELIRNLVEEHRGRVVGSPGDNVLAEFGSVVDAVECAVEIQQVLRAKNALLPETRKMDFRIGINLGDVIEEGDSIYGDGVNIAARLEALADAGGICISESAYQQIENKIPLRYDYLGEHTVKNIARPVKVYRARIEPEAAPAQVIVEKKPAGKGLSRAAMAIIAIVVIAGAVILYQFALRPSPSKTEIASKGKMALPLPDKPSIIVLPFVNMSADPKQEFFADGLTEEIINALSRLPNVFVIARNSSFAYKGKAVDLKQLGREMGVQYVLEGSVRREGNRIRITAQLIDSTTNRHVFSERYDREVKEIFATQDDIAIKVLTALRVAMKDEDFVLFQAKGVSNVEAYFKLLEARKHNEKGNKENNDRARRLAEEALLLDPGSSAAYARLAYADYIDLWVNPLVSREETITHGMTMAKKAIALDDNPYGHGTLALMYVQKRDYDKAVEEGERAAAMDPAMLGIYGTTLHHACRPTEAIPVIQKVLRLNPVKPPSGNLMVLALCYMNAGKYEEALLTSKRLLQENPDHFLGNIALTSTYARMGRMEEARAQLAEVLRINPKFSLDNYEKIIRYKNPDWTKKAIDTYRKLGLK